ncbi:MAG: hypothetical protein PHH59_09560 [Methylovulum sp.]|uniref:hypothetical protein n=1 Tax=Methylovulum sp. TaxID=1916980 RepID=UPI002639B874|nr:hypothetical protein [Methylovulum sp.]MDD2724251.1 hypothetical protein [Methylovulum sp.]MDD5123016.1 hypothetical protein [Methylovulum sp.]
MIGLTACSLPIPGKAQQNLFNVPSSEITQENTVFFQQQFNFAKSDTSNTTIDYGLGNNLEVGINLFNVNLYTPSDTVANPNFLLNFQKAFNITAAYKISFGTQTGFTPPVHNNSLQIPSFSYFSNAVDWARLGKYYLGAYYANSAYAGSNDAIGLMAGVELPMLENKVHLMGDLLSGNNDIGVAVIGLVFYLSDNWQLSIGAQLPPPNSHNDFGTVFEITKL